MRKLVLIYALFFLLGGFLPGGDTFELIKVPSLFDHYSHHNNKENLSFMDFLAMHYFDHDHPSNENHSNLPFFGHSNTVTSVLFSNFYTNTQPFKLLIKEVFQGEDILSVTSGFINTIWQPPKF